MQPESSRLIRAVLTGRGGPGRGSGPPKAAAVDGPRQAAVPVGLGAPQPAGIAAAAAPAANGAGPAPSAAQTRNAFITGVSHQVKSLRQVPFPVMLAEPDAPALVPPCRLLAVDLIAGRSADTPVPTCRSRGERPMTADEIVREKKRRKQQGPSQLSPSAPPQPLVRPPAAQAPPPVVRQPFCTCHASRAPPSPC